MAETATYYYINDLEIVAKMENFIPYVYEKDKGWQIDSNNILTDRLMGYDGEDIGVTRELIKIDEISEEKFPSYSIRFLVVFYCNHQESV